MNISKRGQIQSQIFIYVIAIILFAFILVYGYNAIAGFKERSEQISFIKFKTDLISTIDRISPDYGTLKREEFFIGGEYREVCFVQTKDPPANLAGSISNSIIMDSVESGVNKNVFLLAAGLHESLDVGDIKVDIPFGPPIEGYGCITIINGKAKIEFLGQGDHTVISGWS